MEAKEKAEELMKQFDFVYIQNYTSNFEVKQCALICVEETIKSLEKLLMETYTGYYVKEIARERDFHEEVRDELNKMK